MKIILAPNAFKECLSAAEVARALERGIRRVLPEADIVLIPMADGGDGTVEALVTAAKGEFQDTEVTDPLGRKVRARWGLIHGGRTAVIEMAEASGLRLLSPGERNPLLTTTRGTGELIRAALDAGARDLLIGIGGSATNDAGVGMAVALGYRFLDVHDNPVPDTGGNLIHINRIDSSGVDRRLLDCRIRIACDVTNPLYGPRGAAHVFGPQKGASEEDVLKLDAGLRQISAIIERDLGKDVSNLPGSGAAGGLGAGLMAFAGARLERGTDLILDAVDFIERVRGADLVITGEGRVDCQTFMGKAPEGIARAAAGCGVPTLCVAGSISDDSSEGLKQSCIRAVFPIIHRPCSLEEAISHASDWLADTSEMIARIISKPESPD